MRLSNRLFPPPEGLLISAKWGNDPKRALNEPAKQLQHLFSPYARVRQAAATALDFSSKVQRLFVAGSLTRQHVAEPSSSKH